MSAELAALQSAHRGERPQRTPWPGHRELRLPAADVGGIRLDEAVTVHDVARRLPAIADLRNLCRSLAMLDAIASPAPENRYYFFDTARAEGEEMASMSNGSGDEYSIVFSAAGSFIRGFDHESPMSPYGHHDHAPWPGVLDDIPAVFEPLLEEPAFIDENGVPIVTACLWREPTDDRWHHGTIDFPTGRADPDGSAGLFHLLIDRSPRAYQHFAEDYYEIPVDLAAVSAVYESQPLDQGIVSSLNGEISLTDLAQDISRIGYPQDMSRPVEPNAPR